VKGNFQARFWNSGGRGDSPTDCSGIWLTPGNAMIALPIFPEGFVSPMRVALSARLSPYENLLEPTDHRGTGGMAGDEA
jgi:hypothetical protein